MYLAARPTSCAPVPAFALPPFTTASISSSLGSSSTRDVGSLGPIARRRVARPRASSRRVAAVVAVAPRVASLARVRPPRASRRAPSRPAIGAARAIRVVIAIAIAASVAAPSRASFRRRASSRRRRAARVQNPAAVGAIHHPSHGAHDVLYTTNDAHA